MKSSNGFNITTYGLSEGIHGMHQSSKGSDRPALQNVPVAKQYFTCDIDVPNTLVPQREIREAVNFHLTSGNRTYNTSQLGHRLLLAGPLRLSAGYAVRVGQIWKSVNSLIGWWRSSVLCALECLRWQAECAAASELSRPFARIPTSASSIGRAAWNNTP